MCNRIKYTEEKKCINHMILLGVFFGTVLAKEVGDGDMVHLTTDWPLQRLYYVPQDESHPSCRRSDRFHSHSTAFDR
jgi:hypothetical protein